MSQKPHKWWFATRCAVFQCWCADKNANYWGCEWTWMLRLFVWERSLGMSDWNILDWKQVLILLWRPNMRQPGPYSDLRMQDLGQVRQICEHLDILRLCSRRKTDGNRPHKLLLIWKMTFRAFKIRSRIFLKVPEVREKWDFLSPTAESTWKSQKNCLAEKPLFCS